MRACFLVASVLSGAVFLGTHCVYSCTEVELLGQGVCAFKVFTGTASSPFTELY